MSLIIRRRKERGEIFIGERSYYYYATNEINMNDERSIELTLTKDTITRAQEAGCGERFRAAIARKSTTRRSPP